MLKSKKYIPLLFISLFTLNLLFCNNSSSNPSPPSVANNTKEIISFNFETADNTELSTTVTGVIIGSDITLTLPFGTGITALIPTISHTGTSINPASGTAQNFTTDITYTVTAADSSTQDYTVSVSTYGASISPVDFIASGSTLSGSGSNFDSGATLTYAWSEVTPVPLGISFTDNTSANTDVSFTGWDDASFEAAVAVTIRFTVSDGTNSASADEDIVIYRTDYAYAASGATGDGSAPDNALGSINDAITYAEANGRSVVAVAGGTFNVNYDDSTHIQMVEGVSAAGAYSTDFSSRDTTVNETVIIDNSTGTSSVAAPCCAVEFDDTTMTSSTILDGVSINGRAAGAYGIAVSILNGSPVIQNSIINISEDDDGIGILIKNTACPRIYSNIISGSSDSVDKNINGIYIAQTSDPGSTSEIDSNEINLGGSASSTLNSQIAIRGSEAYNFSITNNVILCGSGNSNHGILLNTSDTISINGNTIDAGTANDYTVGILAGTGSIVIQANTINAGSASTLSTGIIIGLAITEIQNNTIFCSPATVMGYGIADINPISGPSSLTGNNIYNCPTALYRDENADIDYTTVNTEGYFTSGSFILGEGDPEYDNNSSVAP